MRLDSAIAARIAGCGGRGFSLLDSLNASAAAWYPAGMPFKKIKDDERWAPPKLCMHPEHNPPGMIVLQPGTYEYSCPACGHTVRLVVGRTHWLGGDASHVS